jgi:hypothetical protein
MKSTELPIGVVLLKSTEQNQALEVEELHAARAEK